MDKAVTDFSEAAPTAIPVLTVDDHAVWRSAVKSLLFDTEFTVIGEAATGAEALDVARRLHPHVTLLDMRLPDSSGLDIVSKLLELDLDMRVVMLTTYDTPMLKARAIARGAAGYVVKGIGQTELLVALRAACK